MRHNVKNYLIHALLALMAILAPAKGMILTVLALVIADLVTGIMASRKKKKPITSARIRDSITKAFVFELAIILAFLTEQYLTGSDMPVSKWVAGLIGLAELKSVMENLDIVSGGQLMKQILEKLGSANKTEEK